MRQYYTSSPSFSLSGGLGVSGASQPRCLRGSMPSPQHAWQGDAPHQGQRPPWLMPHDAPGPWFPRRDYGPARSFVHALVRFSRRPPREHDRRLSRRWTSRALSAQDTARDLAMVFYTTKQTLSSPSTAGHKGALGEVLWLLALSGTRRLMDEKWPRAPRPSRHLTRDRCLPLLSPFSHAINRDIFRSCFKIRMPTDFLIQKVLQ